MKTVAFFYLSAQAAYQGSVRVATVKECMKTDQFKFCTPVDDVALNADGGGYCCDQANLNYDCASNPNCSQVIKTSQKLAISSQVLYMTFTPG